MAVGFVPRSPTNEKFAGASAIVTTRATVTAVSASLVPADANRDSAVVRNLSKNETIFVGETDPATDLIGVPIAGGESFSFTSVAELFAISDGATADVVIVDEAI